MEKFTEETKNSFCFSYSKFRSFGLNVFLGKEILRLWARRNSSTFDSLAPRKLRFDEDRSRFHRILSNFSPKSSIKEWQTANRLQLGCWNSRWSLKLEFDVSTIRVGSSALVSAQRDEFSVRPVSPEFFLDLFCRSFFRESRRSPLKRKSLEQIIFIDHFLWTKFKIANFRFFLRPKINYDFLCRETTNEKIDWRFLLQSWQVDCSKLTRLYFTSKLLLNILSSNEY